MSTAAVIHYWFPTMTTLLVLLQFLTPKIFIELLHISLLSKLHFGKKIHITRPFTKVAYADPAAVNAAQPGYGGPFSACPVHFLHSIIGPLKAASLIKVCFHLFVRKPWIIILFLIKIKF